MEKALGHLLELARRRLPEVRDYQRECLEEAIRGLEEILRLLVDLDSDRGAIGRKFMAVVIRLDEAGVIEDGRSRPEAAESRRSHP